MTDLDLPDLASLAAAATRPPAFDTLRERAVRRRRARVVTTTAAVAAAVAAIASASLVARGDSDDVEPVGTPTPTVSPTVSATPSITASASPIVTPGPGLADLTAAQIVEDGTLASLARVGDSTLTVWQRCDADYAHCRYAWRLSGTSPTVEGYPGNDLVTATPAGDRFVLTDTGGTCAGLILDPAGDRLPILESIARSADSGDAIVRARGGLQVIDPRSGACWRLGRPTGVEAWDAASIDGDGRIWASAGPSGVDDARTIHEIALWHSRDGRTWTRRSLTVGKPNSPGYVVASGDHIAALATYDGATVLPVGDLAVTADGGRSWHDLARDDVPFEYVDTMAATSGGTLFVVGGALEGGGPPVLYRSTDDAWTHFERVDLPDGLSAGSVIAAGATVVVECGNWQDPIPVTVDDRGQVSRWSQPLR